MYLRKRRLLFIKDHLSLAGELPFSLLPKSTFGLVATLVQGVSCPLYLTNLSVFLHSIRYTLLVGKPPFETNSLKDTYLRIRKNEYYIPTKVSPSARSLLQSLLQLDPSKRPTMTSILNHEFLTTGHCKFEIAMLKSPKCTR